MVTRSAQILVRSHEKISVIRFRFHPRLCNLSFQLPRLRKGLLQIFNLALYLDTELSRRLLKFSRMVILVYPVLQTDYVYDVAVAKTTSPTREVYSVLRRYSCTLIVRSAPADWTDVTLYYSTPLTGSVRL